MSNTEGTTTPPQSAEHPIRGAVAHVQDRVAAAFGIAPAGREATVVAMLEGSSKAAAGYWLQLLLAMGIASLGLALSSTAVVIGAMLISPLMGPIVAFGMGLAVGSPLLVMRALARTALSVLVVVGSAALLVSALPFTEVTAEIAARTAPTALDLAVAVFCALAAAYTAVRPGSDTTATAAGTAIGIALVPPLCVVGHGLATGARAVASGAALLFTANFCAILLFAVLTFLALGYSSVRVPAIEQAEIDKHGRGASARLARGLRFLFGLRYGALLRVLMPILLVGAVFVPLREALGRVTWQVRVRAAVQGMLAALPQATVRSSVTVEGGAVSVRLVTLGRAEDAEHLERELSAKIAATAGVVPKVEVVAVPDAAALEQVAATVKSARPPVEVVRREPDLALVQKALAAALSRSWPAAAGTFVGYRLELPDNAPAVLEVIHLGAELGGAGSALLAQSISRDAAVTLVVRDVAIPVEPIVAERDAGLAWLPRAVALLQRLDVTKGLTACVELPSVQKGRHGKDVEVVAATLRALPALGDGHLEIHEGRRFAARVSASGCPQEARAQP